MQVLGAAGQRRAAGGEDRRLETLELLQIAAGAEHEHAAVPEIVAAGQVVAGGGQVRLLDEAVNCKAAGTHGGALLNVAVAGFRVGGDDAEGHQLAGGGQRQCGLDAGMEGRHVLDQVVGGEHQQDRIVGLGDRLQRRQGDGRRSVAADRLKQDAGALHTQLAQLLGSEEAVLLVADQPRQADIQSIQTLDGRLQHGQLGIGQRQKLLGIELARQRPQA
ncbi:hypothetical protein D3C78_1217720 [compost metagenome]